jgi:hypothetical protein
MVIEHIARQTPANAFQAGEAFYGRSLVERTSGFEGRRPVHEGQALRVGGEPKKAAAYLRVSTQDSARWRGLSPMGLRRFRASCLRSARG